MATHASLRELHESSAVYGAITGRFAFLATPTPMLCLQLRHSIALYSVSPLPPAHFTFLISYPVQGKIRQIVRIPLSGSLDAILVWCDECKVRRKA